MALSTIGRNQLNTGIDDNSDATAITIDSSENVMIGTTDTVPSNNGASGDAGAAIIPDGVFRAARSGNVSLDINRMDSDGDIAAFRKDGTTVGSIGANGSRPFLINPTYGGLKVGTGYSVDPANNSTGAGWDNALDLGAGGTRWKDIYLSGGAYIGGTGSANKLDDYEEGTWTPAPEFGGNSVGITYSHGPSGYYTKVGRMVFVWFGFKFSSKGTSIGAFKIGGLPYSVLNTAAYTHPTNIAGGVPSANASVFMALGSGDRIIYRRLDTTADDPADELDFNNSSGWFHSLIYHTS